MKLKKVLASVMAAAMIMTSTVNAFATDPIPTPVPNEGETAPLMDVVPEADPVKDLFDKLMAFETYEALDAYMTDEMTEEDYVLLGQFSEEQNAALSARVAELQENEIELLARIKIDVKWPTGTKPNEKSDFTVTFTNSNGEKRDVKIKNSQEINLDGNGWSMTSVTPPNGYSAAIGKNNTITLTKVYTKVYS